MIIVIRILTSNPLMISESTPMTAVSPGAWTDPEIAVRMGRLNLKVAVARCLKIEKAVGSLLEIPTPDGGDKREATRSGVCGLRDGTSFLASFFIITESAMVGDKKHVATLTTV